MRKFFLTALLGLSLGFSLNLSAQKAETPKFIGNVEIDFGLCRKFQQKIKIDFSNFNHKIRCSNVSDFLVYSLGLIKK